MRLNRRDQQVINTSTWAGKSNSSASHKAGASRTELGHSWYPVGLLLYGAQSQKGSQVSCTHTEPRGWILVWWYQFKWQALIMLTVPLHKSELALGHVLACRHMETKSTLSETCSFYWPFQQSKSWRSFFQGTSLLWSPIEEKNALLMKTNADAGSY